MKTYNDAEIDALVAEVQEQLLNPLLAEAKEEVLSKAVIQGGSGDEHPKAGHMAKEEKLGDEMSAKAKSNKSPNFPVSKDEHVSTKVPPAMEVQKEKEGSKLPAPMQQMKQDMEGSKVPGPMKPMGKDEMSVGGSASAPSASASAPAVSEGSASAGSDGSVSMPSMSEGSSSGSSSSGSSSSGSSSSGSHSDGMGDAGDMNSLAEAYKGLSDEDLQLHYQALKAALMERMGPSQDMAQAPVSPPMESAPAPAPDPAAAPAGPDMSQKALTMSEKTAQGEELVKAQAKIDELEKNFNGLLKVVETFVKPQRKAVTTMTEFIAKTEGDRPQEVKAKLTKAEIHAKLSEASKNSKLEKKDKDLITKYYLEGGVTVDELSHLLK